MDNSITYDYSCVFKVCGGVQTGARFLIPNGAKVTVGNSIQHNIVLHDASGDNWSALLENDGGRLVLTPLSGVLLLEDQPLAREQRIGVDADVEFNAGVTAFKFSFEEKNPVLHHSIDTSESLATPMMNHFTARWGVGKLAIRKGLFAFSVCWIAVGTLSAIYVITGSLIMVNADPGDEVLSFEHSLDSSELAEVTYERARDGQSYRVAGIVNSREERHRILQMAQKAGTSVDLDIQVNDELREAVEDVYRVYGFKVRADVVGKGHVKVFSASNDVGKLSEVERTVKADVPAITTLELTNNAPGTITVPAKSDPDKRVTLIAAGINAYIMTHDQSRYFVGGMLPSGHVVQSIHDGKVIVSKNGIIETLKY